VTDPTFTLRPAGGSDEALLLRIFAEAHCAGFEQLGLEPGALASLIRMQFHARQAQYRMYPGGAEYLIWRDEVVLGNCWLSDTPEQLRVLDIAVLAEHRRQGVARAVLGEVCARAAAAGKPVRLSVWHQNTAALELYRAFGFVPEPTVLASEPGDLGNGYLELRYCPEAAVRQAGAR
jgi:ribosomal protein S18 acetylase RimI-like enzyme